MTSENRSYEAVIVGGGPAGSTAATVLALKGRRVLVLEKEKFPRYHIGESLLPFCYFPMQRIGMIERMKASHFPKKHAVQFVTQDGKVSTPFYFFKHLDHEAAATWQVLRSEFDQMLLDNAREKGAAVLEETEAIDFLRDDGHTCGVVARAKGGDTVEFRAPMTIDASGRGALAVKRNDWRRWDPSLNKVAVWTYFRGAKRDPGIDDTTFSFGKFIRARPDFHGDLTDCLIGNLDKGFRELFSAVAEFTTVPAPLPYGKPRVERREGLGVRGQGLGVRG